MEKDRLQYARVLIDVSIHKPLLDCITFINEKGIEVDQEAQFEWKPILCEGCNCFGYTED